MKTQLDIIRSGNKHYCGHEWIDVKQDSRTLIQFNLL